MTLNDRLKNQAADDELALFNLYYLMKLSDARGDYKAAAEYHEVREKVKARMQANNTDRVDEANVILNLNVSPWDGTVDTTLPPEPNDGCF